MNLTIFNGKFSQKIFILFVAASFVPLVLSSLISYQYIRGIIEEDVGENLQGVSKEYGLLLFSRLKLAKDTLINNADEIFEKDSLSIAQNNLANYFSALSVVYEDGTNQVFWGGLNKNIYEYGAGGDAKLVVIKKDVFRHDVYIVLNSGVYAKVSSKYLWGVNTLNENFNICILAKSYERLFCDDTVNFSHMEVVKENIDKNNQRFMDIDSYGDHILLSYWSLFMDHEFDIDDWIIIASQSKDVGDAKISDYRNIFIPLVLFSIILVAFLSSVTIRKNLGAVSELLDGTRRVMNKDFNKPIKIDTNDEFNELAESFNEMSSGLKGVFDEYAAFAEVDKLILASKEPDKIIQSIFNSLYVLADFQSLLLINPSKTIRSFEYSYFQKRLHNSLIVGDSDIMTGFDFSLFEEKGLKIFAADNAIFNGTQLGSLHSSNYYCVIPISYDSLGWSFIIGFVNVISFGQIIESKINNFSDRVAVAFQALNRESELRYQADHDALTGVVNRKKIVSVYDQHKDLNSKNKSVSALLFLDLDRFKNVNDSYGHFVGDELLRMIVARLEKNVGDKGVIARLGGDEFAIILGENNKAVLLQQVTTICEKIIFDINDPFMIKNYTIHVGASIGVSLSPDHGETFEESLKYSDIAMYYSKRRGGNVYTLYDTSMGEELLKKTLLEKDLRIALENADIEVHYQSKVGAQSNNIVGFEALFRWTHKTYGNVSPFVAMEIAEDIGVMGILGKLVFEMSVKQWQQWIAKGYQVGTISINVSPSQLIEPHFVKFIKETLDKYPLVAVDMVELEITESVMLQEGQSTLAVLHELRELGLKIAIDDFGTGYSSLSYLLDIPANTLKIDRAFVLKVEQDPNALSLLSSLSELGKSMGYQIVIEGVETQEQATFLKACSVDQFQGYLFSKPLPPEMVESRFLAAQLR